MKHTTNDNKKTTNINLEAKYEQIGYKIDELLGLIHEVYEAEGDTEVINRLAEMKGRELNDSMAYNILDTAYLVKKPPLKEKNLSLESALFRVADKYLRDLIDLVYFSTMVADKVENDAFDAVKERHYCANNLRRSALKIKDMVYSELYSRSQDYRNELERLDKAS